MDQKQIEAWCKLFPHSIFTAIDVRKYVDTQLPIKYGWLRPDQLSWLNELEEEGYDLYFTPNGFDELERKQEKVRYIEWWFADLEYFEKNYLLERINSSKLKPSIVIETKNGYHCLWRIKGISPEWHKVVRGLIEYFGSDISMASLERTLRLPGFHHKKDKDHFRVRVTKFEPSLAYTEDEMLKAFPFVPAEEQTANQMRSIGYDSTEFIEAVRNVNIEQVIGMIPNIELKDNFIYQDGKRTSAFYNRKENYVNRFSGKPGSGTAIDVVMGFVGLDKKEAIDWIASRFGIVKKQLEKEKPIISQIFKTPLDLYRDFHNEIQNISDDDLISTGIKEIDQTIRGIFPSDVIVVAGETGSGKSQFAGNIAMNAIDKGKKAIYFDLENDPLDFFRRQLSIDILKRQNVYIPHHYLRTTEDYARNEEIIEKSLNNVCEKFADKLIMYNNHIVPTIEDFEKMLASVSGYDLVIADHLHYFQFDSDQSDTDNIGRIMRQLRVITKTKRIPIVLVSHLRKRQNKSDPGNDDLFGSSNIAKEASVVIMLSRQVKGIRVAVTKNRTASSLKVWNATPEDGTLKYLQEESDGKEDTFSFSNGNK